MSNVNWSKLVAQNRAKAHGIPWTEAELDAIHKKGMDPEDVRNGALDKEELQEMEDEIKAQGAEKPLSKQKHAELVIKAKGLGINFEEAEVTRGDLILEIEKTLKRNAKAAKKPVAAAPLAPVAGEQSPQAPGDPSQAAQIAPGATE